MRQFPIVFAAISSILCVANASAQHDRLCAAVLLGATASASGRTEVFQRPGPTEGTKVDPRALNATGPSARVRANAEPGVMWTTLFTVSLVIAVF